MKNNKDKKTVKLYDFEEMFQGPLYLKQFHKQIWDAYTKIFFQLFDNYNDLYEELFDNSLPFIHMTTQLTFLQWKACDYYESQLLLTFEASEGIRNKYKSFDVLAKKMKIIFVDTQEEADQYRNLNKGPMIAYSKQYIVDQIYYKCHLDIYAQVILDAFTKYKLISKIQQKDMNDDVWKSKMNEKKDLLFKAIENYKKAGYKKRSEAIGDAKGERRYKSNSSDTEYKELKNALNKYTSLIGRFDPSIHKFIDKLLLDHKIIWVK